MSGNEPIEKIIERLESKNYNWNEIKEALNDSIAAKTEARIQDYVKHYSKGRPCGSLEKQADFDAEDKFLKTCKDNAETLFTQYRHEFDEPKLRPGVDPVKDTDHVASIKKQLKELSTTELLSVAAKLRADCQDGVDAVKTHSTPPSTAPKAATIDLAVRH